MIKQFSYFYSLVIMKTNLYKFYISLLSLFFDYMTLIVKVKGTKPFCGTRKLLWIGTILLLGTNKHIYLAKTKLVQDVNNN